MRLDFCVACGERRPEHLEHHHLVPLIEGGSDDEQNLITLCCACHGKIHGIIRRPMRHLIEKGRAASKAQRAIGDGTAQLKSAARRQQVFRRKQVYARREKAARYADLSALVDRLRLEGFATYTALAGEMNRLGLRRPSGALWDRATLHAKLRYAARFLAKQPTNHPCQAPEGGKGQKPVKGVSLARARDPVTNLAHGGGCPAAERRMYPGGVTNAE